jgi:hypothetical protein
VPMPPRRPGVLAAPPAGLCRLLAACLVLGAAACRLVFLTHDCRLDLAPDEAHYWDWSRHLDWSYYSKGPLVAWLIRGSCELFGPLAVRLTGSLMPAVRLPAVASGALLLVSLYVLTVQVFRREGLALGVVALALTMPLIAAGSSLMTIDAPYTCCWGWALVAGHRAVFRGSRWAWPLAGLLVGVGILAKYTMVLWLPSFGLFLLTTPAYRGLLRRPGFWVLCGTAALCCLPILVWNAGHDWVTVRHVLNLSGAREGPRFTWLGPLVFLASQCAVLLVFWFVAWAAALVAHHPLREEDAGVRYLWWLSLPTFAVFLAFSLKNGGGEVNWPVTAYLSGVVLAAAWLGRQLASPAAWYRRLAAGNLALTCAVGVTLTFLVHGGDRLYPLASRLTGPPTDANPMPLRRLDPTCRLRGYRTLAAEVDAVRAELRAAGEEPVVAGTNWSLPGELGFYCAGHPQAVSIGLGVGDRHSQYDFWPGPITDPDLFRGRTFVLVGIPEPDVKEMFEEIGSSRKVVHYERGQPVAAWGITVCRGYKGPRKPIKGDNF